MPLGRPIPPMILSPEKREELDTISRARSLPLPQALAMRACIILLSAISLSATQIALHPRLSVPTEGKWRRRYQQLGLAGLYDEVKPGGPRSIRLKPHRQKHFKLSTDLFLGENFRDIVGLYLNPPDKALVLNVDEKRGGQPLYRTQPVSSLGKGHVEGVTHDYVRHGTATLFATLDLASGHVPVSGSISLSGISSVLQRHRGHCATGTGHPSGGG
jgi:putative transposase